MLTVEMLPAEHGDALWIEYGPPERPNRLLIDGGTGPAAKAIRATLARRLADVAPEDRRLELLVVTHVDADHIGGILELLKDRSLGLTFGDVWFNGWQHLPDVDDVRGPVQGERLSQLIRQRGLPWNVAFQGGAAVVPEAGELPTVRLPGGLELTLLSPTLAQLRKLRPAWRKAVEAAGLAPVVAPEPEEAAVARRGQIETDEERRMDLPALAHRPFVADGGEPNGSSIALLAEFEGLRCLLAADAFPSVLEASLARLGQERGADRLDLDALKVSHHGSKHNLSPGLLQRVRCNRYLVSTNGQVFNHPDPEAIARLVIHGGPAPQLFFNYRSSRNGRWDDGRLKAQYGYAAAFPAAGGDGVVVSL